MTSPGPVDVISGDILRIDCLSDGIPSPKYKWILADETSIVGQTISVSNFVKNGDYMCTASNILQPSMGEVTTKTVSSYVSARTLCKFVLLCKTQKYYE